MECNLRSENQTVGIRELQRAGHGEYVVVLRSGMRLQSRRSYHEKLKALAWKSVLTDRPTPARSSGLSATAPTRLDAPESFYKFSDNIFERSSIANLWEPRSCGKWTFMMDNRQIPQNRISDPASRHPGLYEVARGLAHLRDYSQRRKPVVSLIDPLPRSQPSG